MISLWRQNVDKHVAPATINSLRKAEGKPPTAFKLGRPKQVRGLSVPELEARGLVGLYELTEDMS